MTREAPLNEEDWAPYTLDTKHLAAGVIFCQSNLKNQAATMEKCDLQTGSEESLSRTPWSLIRKAQVLSDAERMELLAPLMQRYWKSIYAFYRAQRLPHDKAEDLVQGFLCKFLEKEMILLVDESQGQFRNWLLVCMRNYLRDHERKEAAQKNRPVAGLISLDALKANDGLPFEPAAQYDPETACVKAWGRQILERVINVVKDQCEAKGEQLHFDVFFEYYCNRQENRSTWQEIAERFGLRDAKEASHRADLIKKKFRKAIRDEIASYAETEDEINQEIGDLLA